jgi:hypothetical protein
MAKARANKSPTGRVDSARGTRHDENDFDSPETSLRVQLARVRARFGLDPAIPSQVLDEPWTSPGGTVEADEAEFADALADCLSAGLPVNAALASWMSGGLASDEEEEDEEEQTEIGPFAELHVSASNRIVVR